MFIQAIQFSNAGLNGGLELGDNGDFVPQKG